MAPPCWWVRPGRDSLTGTVYAFERDARGVWSAGTPMGTGTAFWDRAGTALALVGNVALVGMPGPPTNLPARFNVAPRSGNVMVFRRNGGSWTQAGQLEPPTADSVRGFGATVLMTESTAFVGVPTVARNAGTVYEFRASGSSWSEASRIVPSTPEPNARFGTVLAAGSGTLMVGAPGMAQLAGGVFTFSRQGDTWIQGQTIVGTDLGGNARLGSSLAFGASVAVVGAPGGAAAVVYAREANGSWREGTAPVRYFGRLAGRSLAAWYAVTAPPIRPPGSAATRWTSSASCRSRPSAATAVSSSTTSGGGPTRSPAVSTPWWGAPTAPRSWT